MKDNDLTASAIQCWSSLENSLGIMPCTVMSMMSEKLLPSACEVDITGALAMYALQLALGSPSAIADWNNNYGSDPDKAVIFHCGNFAKSIFEKVKMSYGDVIATTVGQQNAYGSLAGKIKSGPFTYARFTTDDLNGCLRAYVGEGRVTDDEPNTFGAPGVVDFKPYLDKLFELGIEENYKKYGGIAEMSRQNPKRILGMISINPHLKE